jgi:predicted DCC family thiol-disulfide oxidoreductase YuxK
MTAPASTISHTVPVVRFTIAGEDAYAGLGRPYTCVFDGTCKVCTRLARLLREWDGGEQIEVVASQQSGVMARFPWIPARAYAEALQLIGPGGRTWQGAAAIEQLLNVLPKGRLISWIFKIPFARAIADRFSKWFARNRYHLGCGEHCQSRPLDVEFRES